MSKKENAASWLKSNPFFLALLIAECLVLLLLGYRAIRPPVTLTIQPETFLTINQENAVLTGENAELVLDDPEQQQAEYLSDFYPLSMGGYVLTVRYQSVCNPENPSNSPDDYAGTLTAHSFSNPAAVIGQELKLRDGQGEAKLRVWVKPEARLDDFQLILNYMGKGRLTIQGVVVQEQVVWRFTLLAFWLLMFLLFDFLYCLLLAKSSKTLSELASRYRYEACLCLIVMGASLPLFSNLLFDGHDLTFHLTRIASLGEELAKGQWPARMYTGMLNGYGYPTPLYYCDIFLYLPALLYNVMVPLSSCYQIYGFLVNGVTCLSAYYCFYKITGQKSIGVTCAAVYTLAVYRLTNLYIRAAVGEYTAMAFLPLLVLGMWNIYRKADGEKIGLREYLPLALGLAGIMLCHVLSLEIYGLFLAVICLCLFRKTFQWRRFWALLKAVGIALGLGLWFLGPLLEAMVGMEIQGNRLEVNLKLQDTALYPAQLFSLLPTALSGHVFGGMKGEMPLSLGLPLVLCLILAVYVLVERRPRGLEGERSFRFMRAGCFVSFAAIAMTCYWFPWDSVENWLGGAAAHYLTMVQYAWRYLGVAMIGLTAVCGTALLLLRTKWSEAVFRRVLAAVLLSAVLTAGCFLSQFAENTDTFVSYEQQKPASVSESSETVGSGEYLLKGAELYTVADLRAQTDSPELTVSRDAACEDGTVWNCENNGEEASATLPVFFYEHVQVMDLNTGTEMETKAGENQRISVTVPAGYQGQLSVRYAPPWHWRIYEALSLLTALLLGFLLMWQRKKHKAATI